MYKTGCRVFLVILLFICCARLDASVTATLTFTGSEQAVGVGWDAGSINVSFNGYMEAITYGQYSTPASLASAFAAMFSRDYLSYGLCANASGAVITFKLKNGQPFGQVLVSGSKASFQISQSGFAAEVTAADHGTIALQVNGATVAITNYTIGATPASIASGLAANLASSSVVSAVVNGSQLELTSKTTGAASDYPFSLSTTSFDAMDFTSPSFSSSPASGSLTGGVDQSGQNSAIYGLSISDSSGASGYDSVGNITSLSDSVMGSSSYQYDNLNRVLLSSSGDGKFDCWDYDNVGNRTHQMISVQAFQSAAPCKAASGASTLDNFLTYGNNDNHITASTLLPNGIPGSMGTWPNNGIFDQGGNTINDGTNTYLYDAENRLCAMHGPNGLTGYQYNAQGNRVGKGTITSMSCDITSNGYQATSEYILSQSGEVLTEVLVSSSGSSWQHTNIITDVGLIGAYDTNGLHFYFNDSVGTRRVQTDAQGNVEQTCKSLPFGDGLNCLVSAVFPSENHFTGKERDTESGLDYFGARYYASSMGRFSSPDPSGLYFADPSNPQSLNLYSYGRNNPLVNIDPTGMDCVHINNDTGAYEGTDRGDCDNSTEDKANTGRYVDGTVNTINENSQGQVLGYNGTENDTGNFLSGTFGTPPALQTQDAGLSDQLSPYALGVLQGVAQDTARFPTICSMSFSARVQIPFTPVKAGGTVDLNGRVSGSASLKQAGGSGVPSASLVGRANSNGVAAAQQIGIPIPGTPFEATFARNVAGGPNSYGLSSGSKWKYASLSAAATFSSINDPSCGGH